MTQPPLRIAALAAAAVFVLAGCSDDDNAAQAADRASEVAASCNNSGDPTTVTVYSGRTEKLVKPLLDSIGQDIIGSGVKIEALYDQKPVKVLEEGGKSPADVWFGQDAGELGALASNGYLGELPQQTLGLVPNQYADPEKRWVGVTLRSRILAYDPAQVAAADLPAGIDQLVDAKWRGKIGYAPTNASWKSFVTALRVLRGEDGARTWLQKFKATEPVEFERNGAVLDAVDQGQLTFGLINHYYWFMKAAAQGVDTVKAKVHYFKGAAEPGALVNVAGAGVLTCSNSKEAAAKLVAFLLSSRAQQYFADATGEYPVIANVQSKHNLPTLTELSPPSIDLNQLQSIPDTEAMLEDVGLLK